MPRKDPAKYREYQAKWRAANVEKRAAYQRTRQQKDSEYRKAYQRHYRYGIEATRSCPESCECCGRPAWLESKGLCFDHDHTTGAFRGWLCVQCNVGIGALGDDIAGAEKAVAYLKRAQ